VFVFLCCLIVVGGSGAPVLENSSFEADRYTKYPGTAAANGGIITGWSYTGNAGVNPIWKDPQAQRAPESPFHDNGAIPQGKQLAFIQGPGSLRQMVKGFEEGKCYIVTLRENARVARQGTQWPRVQVKLGGEVIISPHEVTPIAEANAFDVPFYRVESAPFVAPRSGEFELSIETIQESHTTTLLIDAVEIREVTPPVSPK
jgi:hypothetical protein